MSMPPSDTPAEGAEHAVITHLVPAPGQDVRALVARIEACLEAAVEPIGGEHDGAEFGSADAVLYTYGPDADALFDVVAKCLQGVAVGAGSYAVKRYGGVGDPKAREETVELSRG